MQATIQIDLSDKRQIKALQAMLNSMDGDKYRLSQARTDGQRQTVKKQKETKSRKGKPWSKADIAYLRAHYNSMTAPQLAEKLKRDNPQAIYQAAIRFKIKPHLRVVA